MAVSLASLLIQETKVAIYKNALGVAAAIGLPVSSWRPGDPTRSLYLIEAEAFEALEQIVAGYIGSGFREYAAGDWLKILAKQVYNVDVPEATYASGQITLTNSSGYFYNPAPGDLTFKSSLSGKTYHNTSGGVLAGGTTLILDIEADEPGADSTAGAGEIDTMVTTVLGVTCSNALAVVGADEQDPATTRQQCLDKLGSLSPNGPKDAYSYVARNSALTGTTGVSRVRVYSTDATGTVTIYLAGPSGAVTSDVVTAVETAIATYATPLCVTPTVLSASSVTVPVTYSLWLYKSVNKTSAEIDAAIQTALEDMFAQRPIGGDIIPPATTGALYASMIESTIRSAFPQAFRCTVSLPAGDTSLTNGQVPALGTVTPTITLVNDP